MITDALLAAYMRSFYGYGTYRADWWLVGMEEGGGNDWSEVESRLTSWEARGQRELEDVDIFEPFPSLAKWFTPRPPLQATWRGLIRLILAAEGRPIDAETVRAFQGTEVGRLKGSTCVLELMPLPSPSLKHWIYREHSQLTELRDRETYFAAIAPTRIAHIRARIAEHRPRTVIFYSRKYQEQWEGLTGVSFGEPVPPGIHLAHQNGTTFVMTAHPTYRGLTSNYFIEAGKAVAAAMEDHGEGSS